MKKNSLLTYLFIIMFASISLLGCKSQKKVTKSPEPTKKEEVKKEEAVKDSSSEEKKEPVEKTEVELSTAAKLDGHFQNIASAANINLANKNIQEALNYFESAETPVFIAFYKENGEKDYDKPTTIEMFLNYLKDQKKYPYKIDSVVYNDEGKIEEMELITR